MRGVALDGAAAAGGPISTGRRRYALALLLVIYILNFVDRQVMTILAEPVRNELHLRDWQLGILNGLGFLLVYVLLGIPIAWIADRMHRPTLLGAGIGFWSLFTALSGIAASFPFLLFCRVGVGLGEAGCSPTAHSLIADITPPEKRGTALAVFALGNPLGVLVGMALGGLIAQAYGWRAAFFVAAAPGLFLALLTFFTLPEPRHRRPALPTHVADGPARALWRKPSYWLMAVGVGFVTFLIMGTVAFLAPYLLRSQGEAVAALAATVGQALGVELKPLGFLGPAIGFTVGLCGATGTWIGGVAADRVGASGGRRFMLMPAVAAAVAPVFIWLAWQVPGPAAVLALIGAGSLAVALTTAPVYAGVQMVAPPAARALAAAVLLFFLNLTGGFGPLVVGLLSDHFARSHAPGEALRLALAAIVFSGWIGAALFVAAGRFLDRDRT